jgi:F-type H+-transporting ATPase subunit b
MRSGRLLSFVALLTIAMLADGALAAQDEKAHPDAAKEAHGAHATKFEAVIHPPGKAEEIRTLDLSKPEDMKHLTELLQNNELEELKKEKEPNIGDLAGLSWDLALWTVVVFLLLLFILRKVAWKPMLEGLQKREENIKSALEEAKRAHEESLKLRAEMTAQMAAAQDKVKATLDEARKDAQSMADDLINKAKSEITAERQRLNREVALARDQALEAISTHTAELATLVASKALGRGVAIDDQDRLIHEALADLGQHGHKLEKVGV